MQNETAPNPKTEEFVKGLEGIVAAESTITYLDGQRGQMLYKGYDAIELAAKITFEEAVYLLWEGDLPNQAQLTAFSAELAKYRAVPAEVVDIMRKVPAKAHPMDVLRTCVSALGAVDAESQSNSPAVNRRK